MIAKAIAILIAALLLSGCVLKERYRYVQKQPGCFAPAPDPVPGMPDERRPFTSVDCRSAMYKTAFVEFDQQGGPIDPAQADKAIALIKHEKARMATGKVITLVYVHGWKNNGNPAGAGARPQDVERFTSALAELGFRAAQASPANPVPVVGIYIGWKGKSLMGPGMFTWLSYWGRRNTANRVGRDPLTTLLNRVIDTSVTAESDQSRVVLAGHSFGARVLERAVENGVKLYDPEAVRRSATPVRPRVDLVLYINAANDARQGFARVQALQKDPIVVRHPDYDPVVCATKPTDRICKAYPLLVAVTSRGDQATRRVQPIANTLNFDGGAVPFPVLPTVDQYLDPLPSNGTLRKTAPASLRFLQSHQVSETPCPAAPAAAECDPSDPACAFAFRGRGECTACFTARVRQAAATRTPFNETAYWIMDIDPRVIRDHGDIWNQSTLSMLGALIAPRGFFEPLAARMQIRSQ